MQKILLVEDDPFILDIYKQQFVKSGFAVEVATDGAMALEKVKSNKPDVLLLDILLPKIDGWEVLRRIREQPPLENLKVIILSNLSSDNFQEQIKHLKVVKHLLKIETTPEEVVNIIRSTV